MLQEMEGYIIIIMISLSRDCMFVAFSLGRRNQSNHSVKYSVTFWCTDLTQCVVSLKPRGFSGCVNRKCTKWFRFLTLLVAPISGHYFNHTVHFA